MTTRWFISILFMILVTVNRPHASLISVRSIFTALCDLLSFYCFACKKTKKPTLIGWMVCQSTLCMCCRRFQVRCDIGSAAMLELMVTGHVCALRSQGLTTVVLEVCRRGKMTGWELPSKAEGIHSKLGVWQRYWATSCMGSWGQRNLWILL